MANEQKESKKDLDKIFNLLLEEYKMGSSAIAILHQESMKCRIVFLSLAATILGVSISFLELIPENQTISLSGGSNIKFSFLLSFLALIIIITAFTMEFWNINLLHIYNNRMLQIEESFHKFPGLGYDVALLQSNFITLQLSKIDNILDEDIKLLKKHEPNNYYFFPKSLIKFYYKYGIIFLYFLFTTFSLYVLIGFSIIN